MKAGLPTLAAGALLLGALAAVGVLKWENGALRAANEKQARDLGVLETANANQKTVITALRAEAEKTAAMLARAEQEKTTLRDRARYLERRTQEALRHEKTVNTADPWPAAVRNALCLRWLAAERRLPPGYNADDAALAHNAETDPVARFCAAWDRVTPSDTVNWAGALLDHAGELAIDREAAARPPD